MRTEHIFSLGQEKRLNQIDEMINTLIQGKAQIYNRTQTRLLLDIDEYRKYKGLIGIEKEVKEIGSAPENGMIETSEFSEFNAWQVLQEHRCPCGRLLGKFAGRAEVKCPKCGKVNVIEGNRL